MSQTPRRRTLKNLALVLPAAWATPVVTSVVLPAHAQTSTCGAPEGCYRSPGGSSQSFFWPGGTGPFVVQKYSDLDCTEGEESFDELMVAAVDAGQAEALLSASSEPCDLPVFEEVVENPPASGCRFFSCD